MAWPEKICWRSRRFFDSDVRGLPLHEAIYHYAAPDVVELLVDAYPEALLEESVARPQPTTRGREGRREKECVRQLRIEDYYGTL